MQKIFLNNIHGLKNPYLKLVLKSYISGGFVSFVVKVILEQKHARSQFLRNKILTTKNYKPDKLETIMK